MLRLGASMTAEDLALACAREGVTTLDRGTIAKIESSTRKIRAGEVEGVARVFGLSSADLLDPLGPEVFLAYAPDDEAVGAEVDDWLVGHGFRVRSPDRTAPFGEPDHGLLAAITSVAAFVALLSPAFLAAPAMTADLNLAARRHQQIHRAGFVHLLQIADIPDLDASGLYSYQPIDLPQATARKREEALSKLGSAILRGSRPDVRAGQPVPAEDGPEFLNRRDELDRIWGGLNSTVGPHFWLVTGPPGMAKTPFLMRLKAMADEQADRRWITKTVDLQAAADCAADATTLVAKLFDVERSGDPQDDLRAATREIIRSGRPYLCLIDSAELMSPRVIDELRLHLGQIYRQVQDRGDSNLRLTFVAASRTDDGWRGIMPNPRLSTVPFGEFDLDAVQEAVSDLAEGMNLPRPPARLRADAALVHGATEGVPALVRASLQWIRAEEGLDIERLNNPDVFDEIIRPFIQGTLLAPESLLPGEARPSERSERRLRIFERAIKWLVLYRFFTLSHIRHLFGDESFATAAAEAGWSDLDLWRAIGGCALLLRPLNEPWQEIHPAIRRLVFRHFYTEAESLGAHHEAAEFTEQWSAKQSGREQVIGLIDCIWHEAARLRLANVAEMGDDLTEYARERARAIGDSGAYTENELRVYAADRMRSDDELRREFAGNTELFERIVRIVEGVFAHGDVT